MQYVVRNYDLLDLDEVVDIVHRRRVLTRDAVALTLDDGYANSFHYALPVLKELGIPATVFLVSSLVDSDPDYLTRTQIDAMRRSGICFGSHSRTHRPLIDLNVDAVHGEVAGSKGDLEQLLGTRVKYFAYPYGKAGDRDGRAERFVAEHYLAAFTMENRTVGPRSNPYALGRFGMRNCPLYVFKARLSGIFEVHPASWVRRRLRWL
jgi:peptidoglycan/xylan/chitin deacetylase (PgdA/CDA1 family)